MIMYSVPACLSLPSLPLPVRFCLAVGDSGAAAQLDDHLLTVVEGPLVSQLLQGASGVRQHSHPLAGSRKEGGGKVATCQHHGLCLLALPWPHLTLICQQTKIVIILFPPLLNIITGEKPVWLLHKHNQANTNMTRIYWDASKSVLLEADFLLLIGRGCLNPNGIHSRTCFGSRCCSPSQGAIQELMRASGTGPCHQPGCRFMEEQLERRSEEEEQMKGGQEHAEHLPRDINKNLSCLQIWAQDICIYLLCAPLGAMPVGIGFKFLSLHVRKCNLTLKETSKKKKRHLSQWPTMQLSPSLSSTHSSNCRPEAVGQLPKRAEILLETLEL